MNAIPVVIGNELKDLSQAHVFFSNLKLKPEITNKLFAPFLGAIEKELASQYKVSAHISYRSLIAPEKQAMSDFLQFSDVVARFRHADQGQDFFLTVGSDFARTLLRKLLSTTLIDDSLGLLFSSTEKGIFSFILAKILHEIKAPTANRITHIKLLGVYNSQDPALKELLIDKHGMVNLSLAFDEQHFPLTLTFPVSPVQEAAAEIIALPHILSRCGFLSRPLCIKIANLNFDAKTLKTLQFGDVIIFDDTQYDYRDGTLSGRTRADWDNYFLRGDLVAKDNQYRFLPTQPIRWEKKEDEKMEDVHILDAREKDQFSQNKESKIASLANNIRVQLSVELARLPLSLKDICDLHEGSIVDLKRKLDDPLELVVEGKVIGRCTPVKIDGRLGIKILQLFEQNDPQVN